MPVMNRTSNKPNGEAEVSFARDLGLFDASMIGIGAMIGAGIFVLTGIAAGEVVRYVITPGGAEPVAPDGSLPSELDRQHYLEKVLRPVADAISRATSRAAIPLATQRMAAGSPSAGISRASRSRGAAGPPMAPTAPIAAPM